MSLLHICNHIFALQYNQRVNIILWKEKLPTVSQNFVFVFTSLTINVVFLIISNMQESVKHIIIFLYKYYP